MKKVLILGITGTFGSQIAKELQTKGYQIRALVRDTSRVKASLNHVELVTGDVADIDSIRRAANGIDLIVYGISPFNYDWKDKAVPWLSNAAQVAEENRMTILFPGNVYVYDPNDGPDFTEQSRHHPPTSKGVMRHNMEQRLERASKNGAQVIIVRAGDFIAAHSKSSWIPHLLKNRKSHYELTSPGPTNVSHCWAYIPDFCAVASELIERRQSLASFNEYHFRGYKMTMQELAKTIEETTGKPVKLKSFPWWAIQLAAPFSILSKGMLEMRYLWNHPVNLNDQKLYSTLKEYVRTTPIINALQVANLIE